jgi:hypothetical protein
VQGCADIDPVSALRTHLRLLLGGLEMPAVARLGRGVRKKPSAT